MAASLRGQELLDRVAEERPLLEDITKESSEDCDWEN
jgi:hypothetical protein